MIVDDESAIRSLLGTVLAKAGYETTGVESGSALMQALSGPPADAILLDLRLPDADGIELLRQVKKHWPTTQVIILTGCASIDTAVLATKLGAYDFLLKPFEHKSLLLSIERAVDFKQLTEEASALKQALLTMGSGSTPVFQSAAIKKVVRAVERIAPSDVPIIIAGESGVGKEVIADLIHTLSPRAKRPFVKVNCAMLPSESIESALFGSAENAVPPVQPGREGLFRQAEGGTLLLDGLTEMPLETQAKLLRVLQEKECRPVGGRDSYKFDCRIVSSVSVDLAVALKAGTLREDLHYRLSAVVIQVPPLRDRREDILPLARSFLKRFAAQAGRTISGFTFAASERLKSHDWPGNVRQLQNEIQRAVLMTEGIEVDARDLSIADPAAAAATENDLTLLEGLERNLIVQTLKDTNGNKLETARRLGIGRQTLYNKIKAYAIEA